VAEFDVLTARTGKTQTNKEGTVMLRSLKRIAQTGASGNIKHVRKAGGSGPAGKTIKEKSVKRVVPDQLPGGMSENEPLEVHLKENVLRVEFSSEKVGTKKNKEVTNQRAAVSNKHRRTVTRKKKKKFMHPSEKGGESMQKSEAQRRSSLLRRLGGNTVGTCGG